MFHSYVTMFKLPEDTLTSVSIIFTIYALGVCQSAVRFGLQPCHFEKQLLTEIASEDMASAPLKADKHLPGVISPAAASSEAGGHM